MNAYQRIRAYLFSRRAKPESPLMPDEQFEIERKALAFVSANRAGKSDSELYELFLKQAGESQTAREPESDPTPATPETSRQSKPNARGANILSGEYGNESAIHVAPPIDYGRF